LLVIYLKVSKKPSRQDQDSTIENSCAAVDQFYDEEEGGELRPQVESTFSGSRQKKNLGRHHHSKNKTTTTAAPLLLSARQDCSERRWKDPVVPGNNKRQNKPKTRRTKSHRHTDNDDVGNTKITSVATQTPRFMMRHSVSSDLVYDAVDPCKNNRTSYRHGDDTCSELSLELMRNPPMSPPSYHEAVRILANKSEWEQD